MTMCLHFSVGSFWNNVFLLLFFGRSGPVLWREHCLLDVFLGHGAMFTPKDKSALELFWRLALKLKLAIVSPPPSVKTVQGGEVLYGGRGAGRTHVLYVVAGRSLTTRLREGGGAGRKGCHSKEHPFTTHFYIFRAVE